MSLAPNLGAGFICLAGGGILDVPQLELSPCGQCVQEALRFTNRQMGMNLWQKSHFDHIIRREGDFFQVWQYIDGNPAK